MAKNRLQAEIDYNFNLYGLITDVKAHRLAWLLNHHLHIHLIKQKDIVHEFINKEIVTISNFLFRTENAQFRLLKNKSENKNSERSAFLLPELHKFDFFILKEGVLDGKQDEGFYRKIKNIVEIQYITSFDLKKLKSKENLIF
jgi:hypothetical protein